MAKLVFRSVRKTTLADWLLNCTILDDTELIQYTFYSGPVSFGGKNLESIFMKFNENYESKLKFQILKCVGLLEL